MRWKKKTFWKCLSKHWIPHFITQSPLSNMKQYLRSSKSNAITTVNDLSWLENFYSFFGKNKESFRSENHMRLFLIIEFVSLEVFIFFLATISPFTNHVTLFTLAIFRQIPKEFETYHVSPRPQITKIKYNSLLCSLFKNLKKNRST